MTTIGSFCTGIGGLDLAAQHVYGGDVVWCAEIDRHAQTVITERLGDPPNLGDITGIDWAEVASVDILTAGYPCQPFSQAGRRQGTDDERHIWPAIRDAIGHLRPRVVVLENVRGHLTLGFDRVLADLADIGFDAEWTLARSSDIGAPHRRERLFVVAYPVSERGQGAVSIRDRRGEPAAQAGGGNPIVGDTDSVAGPTPVSFGPVEHERYSGRGNRASAEHSRAATDADSITTGGDGRTVPRTETTGPDHGHRSTDGGRVATDAESERWDDTEGRRNCGDEPPRGSFDNWGRYADAVERWERIIGRRAPHPMDDRGRLNPALPEWMMGYPSGWVTDLDIPHTRQLHLIGNAVQPQAAILALESMTQRIEVAA